MKKISGFLAMLVLFVFTFSNIAFADSNAQGTAGENSIQSIPIIYTQDELNKIREIHSEVVKQKLITLNSDGTINVSTDSSKLEVDQNIYEKYIQSVGNINDIIELGVASFDKDFKLNIKPKDTITKVIYERDKKLRQYGIQTENRFDTKNDIVQNSKLLPNINLESIPITDNLYSYQSTAIIANLWAYVIADNNESTLANYLSTMMIYNPKSAYLSTVGFWIAKVEAGGDWDYKTVSGYTPYNKQWNAIQRYTTSIKTSEWFGNYNYGYTGRYLFSLSILLAGGDGVSLFFNHKLDDSQDKTDITQGYNEAA